jgi:hypothetical protein
MPESDPERHIATANMHRAIKFLSAYADRPEDRPFPDVLATAELLARVVALCSEPERLDR